MTNWPTYVGILRAINQPLAELMNREYQDQISAVDLARRYQHEAQEAASRHREQLAQILALPEGTSLKTAQRLAREALDWPYRAVSLDYPRKEN